MEKALVLGATGGIGYTLVHELIHRGVEVIAFSRGKERLQGLYQDESNVSIFIGDALVEKDVMEAVDGVDVIFHAVSFPYEEWKAKHPLCIEMLMKAAETHQAKTL